MRQPNKREWLAWASVLAILGLVFVSYLNPHWQLDLAQRIWACF